MNILWSNEVTSTKFSNTNLDSLITAVNTYKSSSSYMFISEAYFTAMIGGITLTYFCVVTEQVQ